MSSGGDDADIGEEETTKPGVAQTPIGNAIRNLYFALHEIGRDLATATYVVEELEGIERDRMLAALAEKLGELGDLSHDARRAVSSLIVEQAYISIKTK